MANLNSVMLIGRLTRDPEQRTFPSGGQVVGMGFAVNNRRKNQSGEWQDEAVFLDLEAFGKTAEAMGKNLRKGSQIFVAGHLKLDQWTGQDGQSKNKLKIVVDNFQFLDARGAASEMAAQDAAPEPKPAQQDIPF